MGRHYPLKHIMTREDDIRLLSPKLSKLAKVITNWRILLFVLLLSTSVVSGNSQSHPPRERISFDTDWKFIQDDFDNASDADFDDSSWRSLTVPHDWSIEGEYDIDNPMGAQCGYLPTGIGWYRKTIDVPKSWKNRYVEIAFDGIFMNSTVWANGQKLGSRPYGWISFAYDISQMVQEADRITFAVRVDNTKQPSARWYSGSGIYAHTWLVVKNKNHIPRDGIFIRTEGEKVLIETEINGNTKDFIIRNSILDKDGNVVVVTKNKRDTNSDGKVKSELAIEKPKNWSIENPYLYTLRTELLLNTTIEDVVETKFGIRDIEWKAETGMWLNGENVKLQGVCNHQDAGALGAAVPDKILRFRIQQLKDMGVNAIRTAHNPQTPIFYQLCDELGMLVMDEVFDGWTKKAKNDYGAHYFDEWWKKDITDWIKRDRNHPSVIIYSVGNETRGEIGADLVETCHYLDSSRPVTSGHSGSGYMDVLGVNGSSEKGGYIENLEEHQEGKVFIGTENTHTWQVRGYYRTKTWYRDGFPNEKQRPYEIFDLTKKEVFTHDWIDAADRSNSKQIFNSSYDNAVVRVSSRLNIAQIRDNPNYAGSFRWTGYDYIGEASYVHGGWPFKAFMGGAIDLANFEKDLYYLYQSQWTSAPMVHILPHWTHPKLELGTEIPVWVYSNCDEVELFFNDQSLGSVRPRTVWNKMQCQWMVGWRPGTLKAVGYRDGKIVAEEIIETADRPSKIQASVDGEPLKTIKNDIVQVRVITTDEKGEMYPYGENRTYFKVIGSGRLKALDNGSPVDVEQHVGPDNRKAFYGLTRAYVESIDKSGPINLLASSILGEKRLITSNKVSIDVETLNLRGSTVQPNIEIFYTVNGQEPTLNSKKYSGSFEIALETTVKALIVVDGEPVQILQEKFGINEGFTWNKNVGNAPKIGEQAEDAVVQNGKIQSDGENFKGKGYVSLDKIKGASIEWYRENDGGTAMVDLTIRYSVNVDNASGTYVSVLLNNQIQKKKLFLPNTNDMGVSWGILKIPIKISPGANTIKLETLDNKGLYIDEIVIN